MGRQWLVRGYYFCYFGAQACMASYLNVYLQRQLGFDGRALGWFNGLTTLAPAAVLPLLGLWADRTGKSGWLLTGALGVVLAGAGALSFQTGLAGVLAWGAVWETARSACVSLADKSAAELAGTGGGRGYGSLRSFGSLGFLAEGMALGFVTRRWDLGRALFMAYLALVGAALLLSFGFPRTRPPARGPRRPGGLGGLFRLPGFRLALVLGVQGSVGVSALQPYLGNHLVTTMGCSTSILSWNTLCCVGPELLLLPLLGGKLLERWGFCAAALTTSLALALRCAIYALAPNPAVFLAGSLLYGFSVCAYTAVNLALLGRAVPRAHYAGAVLTVAAVSTLGRAGFGWLFGAVYQRWGSGSIFWLLLGVALISSGLLWLGRRGFPQTAEKPAV